MNQLVGPRRDDLISPGSSQYPASPLGKCTDSHCLSLLPASDLSALHGSQSSPCSSGSHNNRTGPVPPTILRGAIECVRGERTELTSTNERVVGEKVMGHERRVLVDDCGRFGYGGGGGSGVRK